MYKNIKYLKGFLLFQIPKIRLDTYFLTCKKLVTDRFGGRHRYIFLNETVKGTVKDCL